MKIRGILSVFFTLCGAGALLSQTSEPPRQPVVLSAGTGFDYSRGDYGYPTDTEVFSVPFNLGYESGPWLLNAGFSYLRVRGPATIVGGSGTARPTSASESGLGDIYLAATYQAGQVVGPLEVAATARLKLPTADEDRGLGTGGTDYYGELTFSRPIGDAIPFFTAGYRVLGDSAVYQLRDGAYVSGGAHFRLSTDNIITVTLNWRRSIAIGSDDSTDAMLMFTHDPDPSWRIMGYGLAGFTEGSPDFGTGLSASYRF